MRDWQETTVGSFCPFLYGKGLPETLRKPGKIPVVSSAGITGSHEKALVSTGGIVIGRKGTVGSLTLLDRPFWPIDTSFYITDEPNQRDLRFTFYLLKTLGLHKMNSDSAVPGLNRDNAHQRTICVPDLTEQRAISAALGALDDKIELNRRMNATLESMARALFKSWFVDFDPVRAKMEDKQPFGMDAATAALFPSRLVPSPLGDIPEGWNDVKFSELFETIGGGTPKTSNPEYWDGDISWFSVVDAPLDSDVFVLNTDKTITQKGVDESSTKVLPEGVTIISARGTVGRLALVGRPMAMNQSCYGLSPANGSTPAFLYFSAKKAVSELQARAHGSVFDTITRDTFDGISVIKPCNKVIQAYEVAAGSMLIKIKGNLLEIDRLEKQRNYLLPKLISGDIRIPDVKKFLEAA